MLLMFSRDPTEGCPAVGKGRECQERQETQFTFCFLYWLPKRATPLRFFETKPDSFSLEMRNLRPKDADLLFQVTRGGVR